MGAGLSIFTSPVTAFDKNKDLDDSSLVSLISSCLCCTMMFMGSTRIPIKNPPMLVAMLVCCISSVFSTIMVGTDLGHRFTRD